MCQTNIVMENEGQEVIVAENASFVEVSEDGITIGTLFEQPKLLKNVAITKIDFTDGKVILTEK